MTLPIKIRDCMSELDAWTSCQDIEPEWRELRAHLLSQDAEIERLRGVVGETAQMAEDADCRLAAADALLREAIEWNWLDEDAPQQAGVNADNPSRMDELYVAIQAHLSENTHG